MEGLIPYLIQAVKRQTHQQSIRYLSNGSGRSYHLLGSAGNSFNGSTDHRSTLPELTPPASLESRLEVKTGNHSYGFRKAHISDYRYEQSENNYGSKGMKKFHQN